MLSGIPYLRTFFDFSDSTLFDVVSVSDFLGLLRKLLKILPKKQAEIMARKSASKRGKLEKK